MVRRKRAHDSELPGVESAIATGGLARAGSATGPRAAAEAVRMATAGLAAPSLVLVFPTGLDPPTAAAAAAAAAGGTRVAGITGSGAIASGGAIEEGASAIAFERAVGAGIGVARNASAGLTAAAERAARQALDAAAPAAGRTVLLLLLDTRAGDQADAVTGAYRVAGPGVPLAGGAAGGPDPAQIVGNEALTETVVAVALTAPSAVSVGSAHGCRVLGPPSIVTRSDGRVLLELDGRPAAGAYLEALGIADGLSDSEFEALAVTHPLAQPELNGESRIRHVLRRAGDGLECATTIPPNAAIEYTREAPESIVEAAGRAVRRALAPLATRPPRAALIFDCAGRKRAVAGSLSHEVDALLGAFDPSPPPLAGLFTHGEVARTRGATGDLNHAVVVVAID